MHIYPAAYAHVKPSFYPADGLTQQHRMCMCPKSLYPQQCLGLKMWPQGIAYP